MDHKMQRTSKGNYRITLSPRELRIIHALLGVTTGRTCDDLYQVLCVAVTRGDFPKWDISVNTSSLINLDEAPL